MNNSEIIIFGPRFTEEGWRKFCQETETMQASCEDCLHPVMLRASASELVEDFPVICYECKEKRYPEIALPIINLADIEQSFEMWEKAERN